ncbi:MAG: adenosine deaminase [Bacteroidetes bacterium]|nr:MAG: adenosine deaminase [Bacteroidota bacterium]
MPLSGDITKLPKIELHVHLDCSLSLEVVQKLRPEITADTYRQTFVAPPKCRDLSDYLTRAAAGISLMQTTDALRQVTLDLFRQLKADGVVYAEIRFAPLEHIQYGLKPGEVVSAVGGAIKEGQQETGIRAGLILCTLRHYSPQQSLDTARLAVQFYGRPVVGFDIASDEALYPLDNHLEAFKFVRKAGIPYTAHAGEACGPESVWETLRKLNPSRIGHGVRSIEDPELMDVLKQDQIHLEICPTSNIQTNVFDRYQDHPVHRFFEAGLSVGINTDARTISSIDLSTEYRNLIQYFGWTEQHFLTCNLQALAHAFADSDTKQSIREILSAAYA